MELTTRGLGDMLKVDNDDHKRGNVSAVCVRKHCTISGSL